MGRGTAYILQVLGTIFPVVSCGLPCSVALRIQLPLCLWVSLDSPYARSDKTHRSMTILCIDCLSLYAILLTKWLHPRGDVPPPYISKGALLSLPSYLTCVSFLSSHLWGEQFRQTGPMVFVHCILQEPTEEYVVCTWHVNCISLHTAHE